MDSTFAVAKKAIRQLEVQWPEEDVFEMIKTTVEAAITSCAVRLFDYGAESELVFNKYVKGRLNRRRFIECSP